MRLVVLADIHGNLPALERCLEAIQDLKADRVLHAGDLVGLCPWPEEVVQRLVDAGIAGVRGNYEADLLAGEPELRFGAPAGGPAPEYRPALQQAYRWTCQAVSYPTRNRLEDLPFSREFEAGGRQVSLFHASPLDPYDALGEDVTEERLTGLLGEAPSEVYLFGHLHLPYHRILDGVHFVCVPSVGRPMDGDPRTGFAVVDLDGVVKVEFVRLEYPVEEAAGALAEVELPPILGDLIRTGS
jgi:putative phosphoesterase